MKPTLAAEELLRNITQYLTTTLAIDDDATREELAAFFTVCRSKVIVATGSLTNPSTWPPPSNWPGSDTSSPASGR